MEGYKGRPIKCAHFISCTEMRDRKTLTRHDNPVVIRLSIYGFIYSGYWKEVLNTDVNPPLGYINTTMDGECLIQCNRKQIWDVFENVTKYMLWNQDHLLVDVHLKTFDEIASAQATLIVKVNMCLLFLFFYSVVECYNEFRFRWCSSFINIC